MEKDRHRAKYIPFRCSSETDEILRSIAAASEKSMSAVLRELVEKGLAAGGYLPGVKELDQIVQDAVAASLQPAVDRLASISAKAAHISAAALLMALYTDRLLLPEPLRGELDEIAGRARRLGIEYLKVSKSADLDEWIARAVGRMAHRQEE